MPKGSILRPTRWIMDGLKLGGKDATFRDRDGKSILFTGLA